MDARSTLQFDFMNLGTLHAFVAMLHAVDAYPISPETEQIDEWCRMYEVMHAALEKQHIFQRHGLEARRHLLAYLDLKRSFVVAALGARRGRMDLIGQEMNEHLDAFNREFQEFAVDLGMRPSASSEATPDTRD